MNDGTVDSALATVSITVTAANDTPVAVAQSVTTAEDTALPITLAGTDVENSALTYTVVSQPANGTLSGTAPNVTYTPSANSNGADSFTFTVNDGSTRSSWRRVARQERLHHLRRRGRPHSSIALPEPARPW